MGKKQRKRTEAAAVEAQTLRMDGTPEEQVTYLHRKILSLQELVDLKNRKLQRVRKRDIQLGKLSDKHEEQIEQIEDEHEKQFHALEERHEREVDKMTTRHEQEIEELESRQDREVEKLESKYNDIYSEDEDSDEENDELAALAEEEERN
jgi:hypothetical protein